MKVQPCKKWSILALLLLGFSSNVEAQTGGGICLTDSRCSVVHANGGFCSPVTRTCVCRDGYTGSYCETVSAVSTAGSSDEASNVNNVVLLATLGASLFIFLRNERNREDEDGIFFQTLYQEYLYN